jgi:hypothetical protein
MLFIQLYKTMTTLRKANKHQDSGFDFELLSREEISAARESTRGQEAEKILNSALYNAVVFVASETVKDVANKTLNSCVVVFKIVGNTVSWMGLGRK